jgi:hypothetical protein
MGRVTVSPW